MRVLWFVLAWVSFALGVIGAFLPLLPTTPFMILSALAFSKSSRRCHQWLLRTPAFGPVILDWQKNRVIRLPAKIAATLMIGSSFLFSLLFLSLPIWALASFAFIATGTLTFIWRQNSREAVQPLPVNNQSHS